MSKRSYERRLKAKRAAEKEARRRAERMRKVRIWISSLVALGALGLVLALCLPGDKAVKPTANQTPTATASGVPGCTSPTVAPSPNGKTFPSPPASSIDSSKLYEATLVTSCGEIKIRMDPKTAPATVNNFVFLARQAYYNGTKFHRVQNESDYAIVQGGDQKGDGTGDPGYSYPGETPPPSTKYKRGIIAMANSGNPSSNGSQFFIVVRDWNGLPTNYTVFGEVFDPDSFSTLDRMILAKGPALQGGLGLSPNPPIFILTATIKEVARS